MELCLNCSAGCCRALNPNIIGIDILKVSKTLGISPFDFVIVVPMEGEKYEENKGKTPMFKFADLRPDTYYKLVLKAVPSPLATTKCIFQLEWKSDETGKIVGRCGIHAVRPMVCRTFPVRLNDKLEAVIEDPHIVYNHKKKTDSFWDNPDYSLCPKPLKPEYYSEFSEQYFHDVYMQHYETDFFLKVADKWNENPDVSDNFIAFLEKEYENRLIPVEYPAECLEKDS